MNCYPETVLRRFASGELDEPGMGEVLRHVENCSRCRHGLRVAERNVERQLLVLADERDWIPPHPRRLKARVYAAVADDRVRRARAGVRQRLRRMSRWKMAPALAAAAVLLLILGARYLGEPRWNGRLEPIRGALLLSPSGESFSLTDGSESLPPGGLIMVPAGGLATLEFEDGNRLELTDSALAVLGSTKGGPRVLVARGIVRVYGNPEGGLLVEAGGQELQVDGECEFEVECDSTAEALAFARERSDRVRSGVIASLLPSAVASPGPSGSGFFIRVSAIHGSVSLPGGRRLATAGREVSRSGGADWSSPVRSARRSATPSATQKILSARLLTQEEMRTVPSLLGRDHSAIRSLLGAARDNDLSPRKRGLAVWLLGEFGDRRAIPGLTRLLAVRRGDPAVVRAAAVRSLSLLGEVDPVLKALLDAEPAVAEAAILSLPLGSGERLRDLAQSGDRPDWQRALAARRADLMGVSVGIPTLLALLDSADPDVHGAAREMIRRIVGETADQILLDLARRGPAAERARALAYLANREVDAAKPIALEGARQSSSSALRAASLRWLARGAPDALGEFTGDALASSDPDVRSAILWSLYRRRPGERTPLPQHREVLTGIALSTWSTLLNRTMALSLLDDPDLVLRALAEDSNPDFLLAVLEYRVAGRLPFEDLSRIRSATRHPRIDLQLVAIDALSLVAPEEAARAIEDRLRDGSMEPDKLMDLLTGPLHAHRLAAAEAPLIRFLVDPGNPVVRLRAAGLLLSRAAEGHRPAIDALIDVAGNPDEDAGVRSAAIRALEPAPPFGPLDSLLRDTLQSTDDAIAVPTAHVVRRRAGRGQPIGIEVLTTIRSDRARALMAAVCPSRPADLKGLLRSKDTVAAAVVLCDLEESDLATFLPEIRDLTVAADPLVRALALCRLPRTEGDRSLLLERLKDADPLVRLTAAAALIARGVNPEPEETFRHLVRAVVRHDMRDLLPLATDLAGGNGHRDLRPQILEQVTRRIDSRIDETRTSNLMRSTLRTVKALRREAGDREGRQILRDDLDLEQLLQAASTLAWAGERADIAPLIALANRNSALQETCRVSVEALLGRTNAGMGGGESLEALASWWEARCYALDVPSPDRWRLSTRR